MIKKRRMIGYQAGILLIICLILFVGFKVLHPYVIKQTPYQITNPPVTFGERLLIIAPHPDDETLGGGGSILKQLRAKKQVKVIIITSGDGYRKAVQEQFHVENPKPEDFRKLGFIRHDESIQTLKTLGVDKSNVLFFGYPDGGVNGLWVANWDPTHLHLGLNGSTHSPYPFAFENMAPYCGANVVKNLMQVIQSYQPTDILYPDPNDAHHDHWATNAFVKYTLTLMKFHTHEWTYLVHRYDWPIPWKYQPDMPQTPPLPLRNIGTVWNALPLSKQEEASKLHAIRQYTSQERVMRGFLEAFVRRNDLFGTYHPIRITRMSGVPNFSQTGQLPFTILHDPVADTVTRELHEGADIESVAMTRTNNHIWIAIQTHQSIRSDYSYFFRVRLFHANGNVTRNDVEVHAGKTIYHSYARNSMNNMQNADVSIQGNRMVLSFPVNTDWQHISHIMVSTDSYEDEKLIDKTAWQTAAWDT